MVAKRSSLTEDGHYKKKSISQNCYFRPQHLFQVVYIYLASVYKCNFTNSQKYYCLSI
jgi:hypothetical protein